MREMIRTADKQEAVAFLTRYLEAGKLVDARMQHQDGVFSVLVTEPTAVCADPEN